MSQDSEPRFDRALADYRVASQAHSARINRLRNRVRASVEEEESVRQALRQLPPASRSSVSRVRQRVAGGARPGPRWPVPRLMVGAAAAAAALFLFVSSEDTEETAALAEVLAPSPPASDPRVPPTDVNTQREPGTDAPAPPIVSPPAGARAQAVVATGRLSPARVREQIAELEPRLSDCVNARSEPLSVSVSCDRFGRPARIAFVPPPSEPTRACLEQALRSVEFEVRVGTTAGVDEGRSGEVRFRLGR